jgi:hypothetical protein
VCWILQSPSISKEKPLLFQTKDMVICVSNVVERSQVWEVKRVIRTCGYEDAKRHRIKVEQRPIY